MKTYKARFKEMNAYYLERIQTLQRRLREKNEGLKQIEKIYRGYIAQLIIKYGEESNHVFLDPNFPILDYMIIGERIKGDQIRFDVIKIKDEKEGEPKTD